METNKLYSIQITKRFLIAYDSIMQRENIASYVLAEKLGLTGSNVTRMKNSTNNYVTVDAMGAMSNLFGIAGTWLLSGFGDMNQNQKQVLQNSIFNKIDILQKTTVTLSTLAEDLKNCN